MNDREAFENWYWDKWEGCPVFVANTKERTFRKYKDSLKYFNNHVQRSCEGWQAAIAHKQAEIVSLREALHQIANETYDSWSNGAKAGQLAKEALENT